MSNCIGYYIGWLMVIALVAALFAVGVLFIGLVPALISIIAALVLTVWAVAASYLLSHYGGDDHA